MRIELHEIPIKDVVKNYVDNAENGVMLDSEVENKKGIYLYVLSRKLKYLNLRQFDDDIKRQKYEMQKGICPHCVAEHREKTHYEYEEMEALLIVTTFPYFVIQLSPSFSPICWQRNSIASCAMSYAFENGE